MQSSKRTHLIVRIEAVNLDKKAIYCSSKDGGRFTLEIPVTRGLYRIPKVGESWMIRRGDLVNWFFEGIVDDRDVYSGPTTEPGDIVLKSANNIIASGDAFFINNDIVGIWTHEEYVVPASSNAAQKTTPDLSPIKTLIESEQSVILNKQGAYGSSISTRPAIKIIEEPNQLIRPLPASSPVPVPATPRVTLLELSGVPTSNTIQVFNNGLLIAPSDIIIRGQSLLFNNPLSPGKAVVFYMRLPEK